MVAGDAYYVSEGPEDLVQNSESLLTQVKDAAEAVHAAADQVIQPRYEPKLLSDPTYFVDTRYILEDLRQFAWKSGQGRNCQVEDLTYNNGNAAIVSLEITTAGDGKATGTEYLVAAARYFGLRVPNGKHPSANTMKLALEKLKALARHAEGVEAAHKTVPVGAKPEAYYVSPSVAQEEPPKKKPTKGPNKNQLTSSSDSADDPFTFTVDTINVGNQRAVVFNENVSPGLVATGGREQLHAILNDSEALQSEFIVNPSGAYIADSQKNTPNSSSSESALVADNQNVLSEAAVQDEEMDLREKYGIPDECPIVQRDKEDKITVDLKDNKVDGSLLADLRTRHPNKKDVPFVIVNDREVFFADEIVELGEGKLDPHRQRIFLTKAGQARYREHVKSETPAKNVAAASGANLSDSAKATERQMGASAPKGTGTSAKGAPAGPYASPRLFNSIADHAAEVAVNYPKGTAGANIFDLLSKQRPGYAKALTVGSTPTTAAPAATAAPTASSAEPSVEKKDGNKHKEDKGKEEKKAA